MKIRIISTSIIFITTMLGGCLFPEATVGITLEIFLDYDEVEAINTSAIQPELSELGYKLNLTSNPMVFRLYRYTDESPNPELAIRIGDRTNNNHTIGSYLLDYNPSPSLHNNEKEIYEAKKYIRKKSDEVVNICNITLDWKLAKWSITVYD